MSRVRAWLSRLWCIVTRRRPADGLTPLSEKVRTEERLEHLRVLATEVETRWWATVDRDRKREQGK